MAVHTAPGALFGRIQVVKKATPASASARALNLASIFERNAIATTLASDTPAAVRDIVSGNGGRTADAGSRYDPDLAKGGGS